MNCPSKILALVCVLTLTAPPGVPQQQKPGPPAPQEQPQARIRIITNVVIVPVTVKDGDGHPVPDLRKEEFRIFEDNVEQKVDQFFNEPFPLSMVVLIDNDLPKGVAQEVESSLPAIVGGLSDQDEVFVCRFDLTFHPGKGFTRDPDKLLTELKRTTLQSSPSNVDTGGPLTSGPSINGRPANGPSPSPPNIILKGERGRSKALDDAVYEAADLLKDRGRDRRKMILLVSDGENAKKYNYSFEDAVKKLQQSDISVFSIGVGSAYLKRKFTPLPKYAHATGGDVYYAARLEAIEELYSRITEEARNQYTLTYSPRDTDRSLDYHSIEVRVKRPGLSIQTRDGYYAPSPSP